MRTLLHLPLLAICGLLVPATGLLRAAEFSKAEITRLTNSVQILKGDTPPKAAVVGQEIGPVTTVATGKESRAELRFPDKTLTRLGANSRFTLRGDARSLDLDEGVLMLQVPKRQGGAKIRTGGVTAAVTGTTILIEYHPGGVVKLLVIEGECTISLNNNGSQFQTLTAGEMITMTDGAASIPKPQAFDLLRLLQTSKLLSLDDSTQPNQNAIVTELANQQKLLQSGDLFKGNIVVPSSGITVGINNNTRAATAPPPPPVMPTLPEYPETEVPPVFE